MGRGGECATPNWPAILYGRRSEIHVLKLQSGTHNWKTGLG